MQIILIIVGAFIGMWLGDGSDEMLGLVLGAGIGYLLGQVGSLKLRVDRLEDRIKRLARRQKTEAAPVSHPSMAETEPPPVPVEPPAVVAAPEPEQPAAAARREAGVPTEQVSGAFGEPVSRTDWAPGSLDKLWALGKEWMTTGNVPVKLGVIVSFFGVAFLLKYAVDKRILVLAMEVRLLLVAIVAAAIFVIGWRLRDKARVYALSLQGGGIGILYLTIFSAYRLYELLPASIAFVLLVLLTAFAGVVAVLQEARALAILGSVGGFLAPVLVTTGSGNHVALFSYYLVLNAAILGIAWYRAWRSLNLIGFGFTFGVGTLWGYEYYRPELFGSTEPFLILYFLFYQAIAVLFAFRQPPNLRGLVDGTIIFGTPVIAFALQAELVGDTEHGLAISAAAMAAFYVMVATWLRRSHGSQMQTLSESFVALGVAFGTIAIPLALDDRWTAVAWALEGGALVWVGVRQQGILAKLSGAALLVASGIAYLRYGWTRDLGMPVINGNVLGGVLISLSSLLSARFLTADAHPRRWQPPGSVALMLWGVGWWLGTGGMEIDDRLDSTLELHATTIFVAVSAAVFAWIAARYRWTAMRRATLAYLPFLPIVAFVYLVDYDHFFEGAGTMAWVLSFAAHFYLLRRYADDDWPIEGVWHYAGVLLIAGVLASEVWWRIDQASFSDVWAASAALFVPALAALLVILVRENLTWPLQRYWAAYLLAAGTLIDMQLLIVGILGLADPGNPAPLPYIPVLNPFDVITIIGLVIGLYCLMTMRETTDWLGPDRWRVATGIWGAAAFVLTTIAVVRGVHHFADIPWERRVLQRSVTVQSALSIYWALLAFSGMIWGARKANRWIWLAATGLMGIVVVKLFLIDLGNTGTVARVVSFLGVGALLLVVGYFAPAPPRRAEAE
jgi:uncharacterized membrane protein